MHQTKKGASDCTISKKHQGRPQRVLARFAESASTPPESCCSVVSHVTKRQTPKTQVCNCKCYHSQTSGLAGTSEASRKPGPRSVASVRARESASNLSAKQSQNPCLAQLGVLSNRTHGRNADALWRVSGNSDLVSACPLSSCQSCKEIASASKETSGETKRGVTKHKQGDMK